MTRTRRSMAVVAAVVAMTGVMTGTSASAALPRDVPIQPGAPIIDPHAYRIPIADPRPQASFCTLNFVFKDKAKKNPRTYIGTARYCVGYVGARVRSPHVGNFGTVVYRNDSGGNANFALIRIDQNKLKYVSRVVRGFGAAPTGYTTSRTTTVGDVLVTHGYPYGAANPALGVTRVGVLGGDHSSRYWSSIQPNIQESGSPVIRADGKAVGISDEMSSFWGTWLPESPPLSQYLTVEGLLKLLRYSGFNVTV